MSDGEPIPDEALIAIYVITDHPRDCPDYFVVRAQYPTRDGGLIASKTASCFHELWKARAWCQQQGLACIPRHPDDDPVFVETWL